MNWIWWAYKSQEWLACHLATFFGLQFQFALKVAKWQANRFCVVCKLIKFNSLILAVLKQVVASERP